MFLPDSAHEHYNLIKDVFVKSTRYSNATAQQTILYVLTYDYLLVLYEVKYVQSKFIIIPLGCFF